MASTTSGDARNFEGAPRAARAFVILNAKSGHGRSDEARASLERHFAASGIACAFHDPAEDQSLGDHIRRAISQGCDLIVAAGGDGTVSSVADALVGTEAVLGIVPLGTANVLAGELGIPEDVDDACRLVSGEHGVTRIDAMEIAGKHYLTQVGVGLDAAMIRDTQGEQKRRFGRLAYVWTAMKGVVGLRPRHFTISVDNATTRPRASQLLVANCGTLGHRPFRWGPDIRPDDGRLDVCILRAGTAWDLLAIGWHFVRGRHRQSPNARYFAAHREVTIRTSTPMHVQADGEIVGETPITIRLKAAAIRVAVPPGQVGPSAEGP